VDEKYKAAIVMHNYQHLVFPNAEAFAAIGADINGLSGGH